VKVEFHPAADSELRAAAKYYNDHVSGLGAEFLAEVEKAAASQSAHAHDSGTLQSHRGGFPADTAHPSSMWFSSPRRARTSSSRAAA